MRKHLMVFIGTWITLVFALFAFPGFEMRGLGMGLIVGYFPFMFTPNLFEHSLHPFVFFSIIFIMSGAIVGLCAWSMYKANITKKIWILLVCLIVIGGIFSGMHSSFERWKRSPAVLAAMESPEVNYQPSRWDFSKQILIPTVIVGSLWGLYTVAEIGFLYSVGILLIRKHYLPRQKQYGQITPAKISPSS